VLSASFDVVIATDCRFPGGNTSSVVEEMHAQHRAGYRTGLLHLPSPTLGRPRPFAPQIRAVLDRGEAELLVGPGPVETKLLMARHPSVFTDLPAELPTVHADQALMVVNNVPLDARKKEPYYDVDHVQRQIKRFTGLDATWAPIGPRMRAELVPYAGNVPMLPIDWENIIDVAAWRTERTGFVSDRPVIGRHSRGHWSKWPDSPTDLAAAYPTEPGYEVRVLGGTQAAVNVLGRLPSNWVDLPFNSEPPREFLAGIDFFVYFHHPGLIEAFGRVVLEALATGAVAIVPSYMEPLFGDACLYGTPADVRPYVDRLYDDWAAYEKQSRAGTELVASRFSYHTHVERLTALIGPPQSPAAPATPPTARPQGTLVIDTRTSREAPLPEPTRQPVVVAVPAAHAGRLAGGAAETFPRVLDELSAADRRRYLKLRIEGLVDAHRPAEVITVDDAGVHREQPSAEPATTSAPPGRLTRAMSALRRRARAAVYSARRRRLRRLKSGARAANVMLVELDEGEVALPVHTNATHSDPGQLPIALVVVTDERLSPEHVVEAVAQRQQITSGFRAAFLAPPDWEPVASSHRLTVETLLPESTWTALYGSGWTDYVRRRIEETCRVIHPVTVVRVGAGDDEAGRIDAALAVLESARVRRRLGGRD
jgi:hypothetical protein